MSDVIVYILIGLLILGVIFGGIGYGIWRFFKGRNTDQEKGSGGVFFSQKEAIMHLLFVASPGFLLAGIIRIADGEGSLAVVLGGISLVTIILAFSLRLAYGVLIGYLGGVLAWIRFMIEKIEENNARFYGGSEVYDTMIAAMFIGIFLLCVLMYISGRIASKFKEATRLAYSFMVLGILGGVGVMLLLAFEEITDSIRVAHFSEGDGISWVIGLLGAVVISGISYASVRTKTIYTIEGVSLGVLTLLAVGWFSIKTSSAPLAETLPTLIPNTVTLLTIIGILLLGGQRSEKWMINIGAVLLIIWMLATYGAWSSALLGSGTVFILGGLFLLLVGWGVEKTRRWAISSTEEQNT